MDSRDVLKTAADMLFPRRCPSCGTGLRAGSGTLCPECSSKLRSSATALISRSRDLERIVSCFPYSGVPKECIKRMKYGGDKNIPEAFFPAIRKIAVAFLGHLRPDMVIPVPLHASRERRRGFNQSYLLARTVAAAVGAPVDTSVMERTRNTIPQAGLGIKERASNMKDAFFCVSPDKIAGKDILLVDDVLTTGATLNACARAAVSSGAFSVRGFTLARTGDTLLSTFFIDEVDTEKRE